MDFLKLDEHVTRLMDAGKFDIAEAELHKARLQAAKGKDQRVLENVLSLLVELYCIMQPPDLIKAESYALERERVSGRGYAKLQTAMLLYWSIENPSRTLTKAQEAVAQATEEQDDMTRYQSLTLQGLALLDLHQYEEALRILCELQKMVSTRLRIVVGDETLFLERLFTESKDMKTRASIQDVATILWPVCRDSEFSSRLKVLATRNC